MVLGPQWPADPGAAGSDDTWEMSVITVPVVLSDLAADVLRTSGADVVEMRDAHGTAGADAASDAREELWTALAVDSAVLEALHAACDGDVSVRVERVPRTVADTWRDHAAPVAVGPVTIVPAWKQWERGDAEIPVRIDPEHLFGLGDHPTTRSVLTELLALDPPPVRIVDAGCGSGVLGITAAVLALARARMPPEILGFDVAPDASAVVARNCQMNGVDTFRTVAPREIPSAWADVTVANILAPVLRELAPTLERVTAPGGRVILGGMRRHQWRDVVALYTGSTLERLDDTDGWMVACLRRER